MNSSDNKLHLMGDTVIDWIISKGVPKAFPGGIGNISRGLKLLDYQTELTTIHNPAIFPLHAVMSLSSSCISDLKYINVYVRDYDSSIFNRFQNGTRTGVFSGTSDIVVAHEKSCVGKFEATFADIKTAEVNGKTKYLRLSSGDNYRAVMKEVAFEWAIVSFRSEVVLLNKKRRREHIEQFEVLPAIDTCGAGDTFHVGFIAAILEGCQIPVAIKRAIAIASEKVMKIGVFAD